MPMSDETKTIPTVGPGVANSDTSHATPEPTPHADSPETPETPAAPPPPPPAPEAPGSQPSSPVAPFPHPATPPTPAAAAATQPAPATPPASAAAAPGSTGSPQSGTTAAVPGSAATGAYGGQTASGAYGGPHASSPAPPASPVPPGAPAPGAPASAQPTPPHAPGHPQPPSQPPTASPVPPPPPGRGRRAVAVLTAAGLMLVSATGGALLALNLDDNTTTTTTPVATSLSSPASGSSNSAPDEPLSQAAAAVLPSVVSISFDAGQVAGSGSGIIISTDGQILTNNHVVEAVANGGDLKVTFADGSTADADIVGRDPATDLAVIKAKNVSGLKPAKFGSSESLHVGDTVLAIGSPLGLDGSVSAGIVSALGRSVTLGAENESPFGGSSGASQSVVIDAIQTDAAINPGNSGGALVNTDGEVVGINTAIASLAQNSSGQGGNIGVGFAIPIDSAKDIAQQLIDHGQVTHAFLGVRLTEPENGGGALIVGVEQGQPAAQAGLQAGDLITKVGDNDVRNAADLTAAIRTLKPGDKVVVSYTRGGEQKTAEVTLGELPTDGNG
jgi:putative serine protease PepD